MARSFWGGVELADDTIVGAGSVVTHSVKTPGMVIAGNPAHVICSVEDYMRKNEPLSVNVEKMSWVQVRNYFEQHSEKLVQRSSL